ERLGGLAREPQLAALRVVAEALQRHGGNLRRQQLVLRDDGHLSNELRGVATDEDDETAEAGVPRLLQELERSGRVVTDDRGSRASECSHDGALATRLYFEQRKSYALAVLGEV